VIRVGESWRTRNGHRRWVSMPLGLLVLFFAITWPYWAVLYSIKLIVLLFYICYCIVRWLVITIGEIHGAYTHARE